MIIKFFWYFFSILTIFLILISNPKSNSTGFSSSQNRILNFSSSQMFVQKLIAFTTFIFFILTCLSLLLI